MSLPGNGIFVVQGEMTILMTAIRRGTRWTSHAHQEEEVDHLLRSLQTLKEILNKITDLRYIEADIYLSPFLEVIRSEETTGPVTSLALAAVNKFLSYGLIDSTHSCAPQTIYNIADAVTHARFVGTDQSSDGVVLLRILQVLRTLTLAPEGTMLTNESLCEIMLSCFRICFEDRIHELLKKTAEQYLKDMVQLVFIRLPQFSEDTCTIGIKQLKMRPGAIDHSRTKRKSRHSFRKKEKSVDTSPDLKTTKQTTSKTIFPHTIAIDASDSHHLIPKDGSFIDSSHLVKNDESTDQRTDGPEPIEPSHKATKEIENSIQTAELIDPAVSVDLSKLEISSSITSIDGQCISGMESNIEYVNQRGIRFTPQNQDESNLLPYGLACVRELFRFLISLCNPNDKQNTDVMIHLGLTLLSVAFEVAADSIRKHSPLLCLVKDDLCRNLYSLLNSERISVFATDLQVSFLVFESLRTHLKFQMESYLTKLIEIVISESPKATYEHKEIALDNIVQLWRIPNFVNELYLNYDCDMYCTNLYENLTKLLAKNTCSATTGVYHTHILSLDALLAVIEGIEVRCSKRNSENSGSSQIILPKTKNSKIKYADRVPPIEDLMARKSIKKWLPQGTEYFNSKPKKGIQFLQEHGVLKIELDPHEVAMFLRENSALDKKMIGEFISSRNNLHILEAFVKTFDFKGLRIDESLRNFLESFRLPGEAPTISLILEHFAEHWHKSNNEPFADVDSAFTLAYAVIMLNVDQHNQNAKKQTVPMSLAAFKKNLKGVNGGDDFNEEMLDEIYAAIKNDEIIMPAEQTGLVRENYLWKVLLKKGESPDGVFLHIPHGTYDSELLKIVYGSVTTALAFVYEKAEDIAIFKKAMAGLEKCAFVSAQFGMTENVDMLLDIICKFTMFNDQRRQPHLLVQFGSNPKAQLALKSLFSLTHLHGDSIREGWKNVLDIILALYSNNLLTKTYVESEDFINQSGKIVFVYEESENTQKQDSGLFSSLYSYMVSTENLSKSPTLEEEQCLNIAKDSIKDCNLDQLITDSKFLHSDALLELVKALIELSRGPEFQKSLGYNYSENVAVFFMELLFKIVIQNRDRILTIWHLVRDHIYTLMMNASVFDYQLLLERSVIGLLRIAIRLMRNEEMCPIVIQSLKMLLLLKSHILYRISRQISFGLYELLKTSAQNIHTSTDWTIIFTLLECVGAGAPTPKPVSDDGGFLDKGTKSEGENQPNSDEESVNTDRGYTSDSELTKSPKIAQQHRSQSAIVVPAPSSFSTSNNGGWILVGNEGQIHAKSLPPVQYGIALERNLGPYDPLSLEKCCDSLAFLVRDVAHITPYNFDMCVHCIRTFVEASMHESRKSKKSNRDFRPRRKTSLRKKPEIVKNKSFITSHNEESDDADESRGYHYLLLDLIHTLHTRTAQIFKWWAEEGGEINQEVSLWLQGWCPLLQGIARMCCDKREGVRISAISFLQRALLVHDLQTLTGYEWEQCFHRVLFPLLHYLLQPIDPHSPFKMAEFRNRAATVLSKVFLHHLSPLLTLPTFNSLWSIVLDFMDKYMHADKSDILYEAIPELLKNMLLVMNSARVFEGPEGKNILWHATWERIDKFLPNLKNELFKETDKSSVADEVQREIVYAVNANQYNAEDITTSNIVQPSAPRQHV